MSAIDHQDEIVGIGGVDRLDRGVGDGIEGSAIVVLVMNRKGPPFQKIRDREPDVAGVGLDGNLVEPVRSDFPVACLALGSDDVTRDCLGRWSVERQTWEVSSELDNMQHSGQIILILILGMSGLRHGARVMGSPKVRGGPGVRVRGRRVSDRRDHPRPRH